MRKYCSNNEQLPFNLLGCTVNFLVYARYIFHASVFVFHLITHLLVFLSFHTNSPQINIKNGAIVTPW